MHFPEASVAIANACWHHVNTSEALAVQLYHLLDLSRRDCITACSEPGNLGLLGGNPLVRATMTHQMETRFLVPAVAAGGAGPGPDTSAPAFSARVATGLLKLNL